MLSLLSFGESRGRGPWKCSCKPWNGDVMGSFGLQPSQDAEMVVMRSMTNPFVIKFSPRQNTAKVCRTLVAKSA